MRSLVVLFAITVVLAQGAQVLNDLWSWDGQKLVAKFGHSSSVSVWFSSVAEKNSEGTWLQNLTSVVLPSTLTLSTSASYVKAVGVSTVKLSSGKSSTLTTTVYLARTAFDLPWPNGEKVNVPAGYMKVNLDFAWPVQSGTTGSIVVGMKASWNVAKLDAILECCSLKSEVLHTNGKTSGFHIIQPFDLYLDMPVDPMLWDANNQTLTPTVSFSGEPPSLANALTGTAAVEVTVSPVASRVLVDPIIHASASSLLPCLLILLLGSLFALL